VIKPLLIAALMLVAVPARAETIIIDIVDGPGGEGSEGMFWSLTYLEYPGATFEITRTFDPLLATGTFEVTVFTEVAAVPEPTTWAMLLTGFVLLGGWRWRSRHSVQKS
jgi:hypothetical protein